ncbi:hypothetical protein [Microvirga tunisiensis]|uniref:Uncharacterized protein n=1 Tax=Microvirga tunisiensis TaxID=2108360 RepID=A0A5N7MWG3_9HYPH|nr:hypothetical protein [Microvirga tunisiensis]MPR12873.1 hypothetical protein [Microvirga tunisiensis]MPR30819.1 hypothetical protein [Microvirga tunisiensis]
MSHGPIEEQHRSVMNTLAGALDEVFNGPSTDDRVRTTGFALLVFPLGKDISGTGRVNYIGNGARADMLVALKELVARWEGCIPSEEDRA